MVECADTVYTVECACVWNESAESGKKCRSGVDSGQTFYGANQEVFRCERIDTLGDCIEGEQLVSWISNITFKDGFTEENV